MRNYLCRMIGFFCLLLCALSGTSQEAKGPILLKKLERHFAKMDSLLLLPDSKSIGTQCQKASLPATLPMDSALVARSNARVREFAAMTGLNWVGQVYYRPDEQLGLEEDNLAVSRYKGKVQAELRWDYMQSAWFQRKVKVRGIVLEELIDRKQYSKETYDAWQKEQKELLGDYYDTLLAALLSYRLANLSQLSDIHLYVLSQEMAGNELLALMLSEKADCERRYEQLNPSSVAAWEKASQEGTLLCTPPPYTQVKLDTLQIFERVRQSNLNVEILQLRKQLLDLKAKSATYLASSSVSPFMRYSHYFRTGGDSSKNLDLGVTFSLPLSNEAKRKRQVLQSERGVLEVEQQEVGKVAEQEVRALVVAIERCDRMIEGENRRLNEAKQYIQMRTDAYRRQRGDFNALARIKEYDQYFTCWEKLLNNYRQRDLLMVDLQAFLVDCPVSDLCY